MPSFSHLGELYKSNFGLLTDLYQLTMAKAYWHQGIHNKPAVFHLFFRENPFGNPYTISAGLAMAIDYLQALHFSTADIQYLGGLKGEDGQSLFEEGFLHYLQTFTFRCDIDAIPEGTCVFPQQPLIRVKGPLLQAQLIETALLNLVNFSSLIATKSARICQAAGSDSVLEFGLRRAQGIDGGLTASRSAYIGGCQATSNVLAGRYYHIPVKGTHAHSWIMCFGDELEAFEAYADALPNNCIFLVDTYDTLEGVEHALKVGRSLRKKGHELLGIRLDSGNLAALSIQARQLLDQAGFPDTQIVASDRLDENRIKELKQDGAQIGVWGVGTHLATAKDQPALGGVYKLAAIKEYDQWHHRIKLSEELEKASYPGFLQVKRYFDVNNKPIRDVLYNEWSSESTLKEVQTHNGNDMPSNHGKSSVNLLRPIFKAGKLVYTPPSIKEIRAFCLKQQALFTDLAPYPSGSTKHLGQEKKTLMKPYQSA